MTMTKTNLELQPVSLSLPRDFHEACELLDSPCTHNIVTSGIAYMKQHDCLEAMRDFEILAALAQRQYRERTR